MSLEEYGLRMRAKRLQELDATRQTIQMQLTQRAMQAVKGKQYAIKDISDILDFESSEAQLLGDTDAAAADTFDQLLEVAKRLKEFRAMQAQQGKEAADDDIGASGVEENTDGEAIEGE